MFTLTGHNVSDKDKTAGSEGTSTDLADKVKSMEAEMHALEEEYQKYLLGQQKVYLHSNPKTCVTIEVFNGYDTETLDYCSREHRW